MSLRDAGRALAPMICCLVIAACNGGSSSGTQGAPPGQNVPGAPGGDQGGSGNRGGDQGGGGGDVPVGPYKIPDIVINAGIVYENLADWGKLESAFWSACPGGSHCVTPVFTLVDGADDVYSACAMEGLEVDGVAITERGTSVPMGSRIVVSFKRPCPGLEGGGAGVSPASSESPATDVPATNEPYTP